MVFPIKHKKVLSIAAAVLSAAVILAAFYAFRHKDTASQPAKIDERPVEPNKPKTNSPPAAVADSRTAKLIKDMQNIDTVYSKDLLKLYPLGYTLFSIEKGAEIVVMDKERLKDKLIITWDGSEVTDWTDKHLSITVTALYDIETGNIFKNPGIIIPRKTGTAYQAQSIGKLKIFTETIVDDSEGLICLIGLKE